MTPSSEVDLANGHSDREKMRLQNVERWPRQNNEADDNDGKNEVIKISIFVGGNDRSFKSSVKAVNDFRLFPLFLFACSASLPR